MQRGRRATGADEAMKALYGRNRAIVNEPWDLPIAYRLDGDKLVCSLTLKIKVDLNEMSIVAAKRVVPQMFKQCILMTSPSYTGQTEAEAAGL